MRSFALAVVLALVRATSYDVVVYDATSGGVTAAVSAARQGLRTALLCAAWPACFPEGGHRLGGMSSSGLGQTDLGPTGPYIGGIAREFYERNRARYRHIVDEEIALVDDRGTEGSDGDSQCRLPSSSCNVTFNLEPHVAEEIFRSMLQEDGVDVFYSAQVGSVQLSNDSALAAPVITSMLTTDGRAFSARMWVDASYEGDLLAHAGVSYSVGREARSEYGESLAGMAVGAASSQFDIAVDPFDADGAPLPLTILPPQGRELGSGDALVESYNFRLCVTTDASNVVPWPKPANYNASDWELLRRYVVACIGHRADGEEGRSCQLGFPSCNNRRVPSDGKSDMNNCGGIASDFIGGSWAYPEASYEQRKQIWQQHLHYQQGLLWTLAHDPVMPVSVRATMAKTGLCADEFKDNALAEHWPPSLYVREARRLSGTQVFSQETPAQQKAQGGIGKLSIAIGGYNFDSHNVQRWACRNMSSCYGAEPKGSAASASYAWDEGNVESGPGLYQIPYWVMLPKESEAANLLVVAAPSATHIGISTLRMEPQFMMMGHAAGTAAALALSTGTSVQRADLDSLNGALIAEKMVLDTSPQQANLIYV